MLGKLGLQPPLQHPLDQLGEEPVRAGQPRPVRAQRRHRLVQPGLIHQLRQTLPHRPASRGTVQTPVGGAGAIHPATRGRIGQLTLTGSHRFTLTGDHPRRRHRMLPFTDNRSYTGYNFTFLT
ncbi:hypothetical protein, partial [Micromonospora globbae]|uniref:hypothetical protein n=1 Tax=Micromonospora globbae TaxID=1894969 RepID=UPI003F4DAD8B